jgi:hypothetical protein
MNPPVAVMIPETLIFAGSLALSMVGRTVLRIVPFVILSAFKLVIFVPKPAKAYAVTTPDALISPVELNPTPLPLAFGLAPTWKVLRGSVVAIPTLPAA